MQASDVLASSLFLCFSFVDFSSTFRYLFCCHLGMAPKDSVCDTPIVGGPLSLSYIKESIPLPEPSPPPPPPSSFASLSELPVEPACNIALCCWLGAAPNYCIADELEAHSTLTHFLRLCKLATSITPKHLPVKAVLAGCVALGFPRVVSIRDN